MYILAGVGLLGIGLDDATVNAACIHKVTHADAQGSQDQYDKRIHRSTLLLSKATDQEARLRHLCVGLARLSDPRGTSFRPRIPPIVRCWDPVGPTASGHYRRETRLLINVRASSYCTLEVLQESFTGLGREPHHFHLQLDVRVGLAPGEAVQVRRVRLEPGLQLLHLGLCARPAICDRQSLRSCLPRPGVILFSMQTPRCRALIRTRPPPRPGVASVASLLL